MSCLYFQLLGQPKILKNNKEVIFSYTKINALLIYLFYHKQVNREELASLLWPNKPSSTSRKNLRNCIYQANKILGDEVIISHNRATLTLNSDLTITGDIDLFNENPVRHLQLYQGPFLQDFYLKDSEAFEFWVTKIRTKLENAYSQASYDKLKHFDKKSHFKEKEELLINLIEMDEFEEKNYQLLMQLYQEQNRTGKVIETYYKMVDLFDRELGISPSEATQNFYASVLQNDSSRSDEGTGLHAEFLFERVSEVKQLEDFFQTIQDVTLPKILVIQGNTGSGKRTLLRKILTNKKKKYHTLSITCKHDDAQLDYQIIYKIINQLYLMTLQEQFISLEEWSAIYDNYFPRIAPIDLRIHSLNENNLLTNLLTSLLTKSTNTQPFFLLIEESHWMDDKSLTIIQDTFSNLKNLPAGLILTKYKHHTYGLDYFINQQKLLKRIKVVELAPLSFSDTKQHLKNSIKSKELSNDLLLKIFTISQGNPFLLSEYIDSINKNQDWSPLTPAIRAKIAVKLGHLSSLEEELLDYVSCCQDPVSLKTLCHLLATTEMVLVPIIDRLCELHILSQKEHLGDVAIHFHQNVIPYFIYDNLSIAKRKILHLRIAEYLEQKSKHLPDQDTLEELAFHFLKAREPLKALKYKIEALNCKLQFSHELFPMTYDKGFHFTERHEKSSTIDATFNALWNELHGLEEKFSLLEEFQVLELRLLYLEGRYLIRIGNYSKGINHIQKVISKAIEFKQTDYLIEGYKQIIYYCIQEEQISELQHYTELALEASAEANNHEAIGVALRLRGLYYLINGEEALAKQFLKNSIVAFSVTDSLKQKYAIQIAAALDYLGEIQQINGQFNQAISYQSRAISLAKDYDAGSYYLLFRIRLAVSYYWQGDVTNANRIFKTISIKHLREELPWLEIQIIIYQILLAIAEKNTEKVISLLQDTLVLEKEISNKRDTGLFFFLLAILKHYQQKTALKVMPFSEKMVHSFNYYKEQAVINLNPYRDQLLIKQLESMMD